MVDWTKPIQFKNGEGCELVQTKHDGWRQFRPRPDGAYPTRCILRHGIEQAEAAYWHVHEDGVTSWPEERGYQVINTPRD